MIRLLRLFRRRPKLPDIPPSPYRAPAVDIKPLQPKDPDYVVTETEMTQTGMFRIFPWLKKKDDHSGSS
jgi:hypothetical protein